MFDDLKITPDVYPLVQDAVGDVGKMLWILLGTVGMVLLIACANVANLCLVRAESRHQEFAIRTALGASRGQIARSLLSESVALGLIGGVLGVALARAGLALLVWFAPDGLPRLNEIEINGVVLLFTLGMSLLAGLLFGLIPVMRFGEPSVTALKEGGRSASEGPSAPSRAKHAGRRRDRAGAGAAGRLGADDSELPGAARGRSRLPQSGPGADLPHLGSRRPRRRSRIRSFERTSRSPSSWLAFPA